VFLDTTYRPPAARADDDGGSGKIIFVPGSGGDLQAALDTALPGDVIMLEAGATFQGPFVLPNKRRPPRWDDDGEGSPCSREGRGRGRRAQRCWIIVRSSAPDSALPPPGARIDPSYAPVMPKIVVGHEGGAIRTTPGAHHFRFIGIEFAPTPGAFPIDLIHLGGNDFTVDVVPHHIIFDRCYVHGDPAVGGRLGILMNSASTAVIGSYLADLKWVGNDSAAIQSWNGTGPFKIVNNYLEAASVNLFFGGGSDPTIPNLVPSDIEVRGNHFAKPLAWRVGDPTYAGTPWTVKNFFELKNAQRVLVDGNVFEYNWKQSGQDGFAVEFTPRNQDGGAPWAVVQDVAFTHNIVRHTTAGIHFLGQDNFQPSRQLQRVLIQDNLFVDVGAFASNGGSVGRLFQLRDGTADIVIDHNTALQTGSPVWAQVSTGAVHTGFVFTNNIAPNNQRGVSSDRPVGNALATLSAYFPGYVFARNVLPGGDPLGYPPDNSFPAALAQVGFADFAGGDYRLGASSPYKDAGTDGRDIGADIDELLVATATAVSGTPPPLPPE
jgi:hypothetical protein